VNQKTAGRPRHRRRLRWISTVAVLLVSVAILALAALKIWIVPTMARERIHDTISKLFNGAVHVQPVHLDLRGRIHTDNVTVADARGRPRLRLEQVQLVLAGLSHGQIYARAAKIGSLDMDLYPGPSTPLLKHIRAAGSGGPGISEIDVRDFTVEQHIGDKAAVWLDNAQLMATHNQRAYHISLAHVPDANGGLIDVNATVDPGSSGLQLDARIDHMFDAGQAAALLSWAGLPAQFTGSGRFSVNMQVHGNYADPNALGMDGRADFTQGSLSYRGGPLLSDVSLNCDVNDRRVQMRLDGRMLGGSLDGTATLEHAGLVLGTGQWQVTLDQADMSRLADQAPDSLNQGIVSGHYQGGFSQPAFSDVNGTGEIQFSDSNIQLMPVVGRILDAMVTMDGGALEHSDAVVIFANQGPLLTIENGSIANPVSAIQIEGGGRIDLREHYLDFNAVWVPVKQVDSLISQVPLANLFLAVKNKLIRVHVEGHWGQPISSLISKQPVQDVSDALFGFFKDVAQSGGRLTQGVLQNLGNQHDNPQDQAAPEETGSPKHSPDRN